MTNCGSCLKIKNELTHCVPCVEMNIYLKISNFLFVFHRHWQRRQRICSCLIWVFAFQSQQLQFQRWLEFKMSITRMNFSQLHRLKHHGSVSQTRYEYEYEIGTAIIINWLNCCFRCAWQSHSTVGQFIVNDDYRLQTLFMHVYTNKSHWIANNQSADANLTDANWNCMFICWIFILSIHFVSFRSVGPKTVNDPREHSICARMVSVVAVDSRLARIFRNRTTRFSHWIDGSAHFDISRRNLVSLTFWGFSKENFEYFSNCFSTFSHWNSSEPSTRGVLIGYTFICHTLGMFIIMALNMFMPWRTVSLVCLGLPVIAAISICFIPETPQWLLSKNRSSDAEKSIRWLRGWASSEVVAQEFQDLQRHSERSKSCNTCVKQNLKCTHLSLPTMRDKFTELKRKQTLKPFVIVMSLFFLVHMTGVLPMRPFIVQIFKAYESPIAPDQAATIMSFLDNLANITFMCLVKFSGKRKLYLTMLSGVFLCTLTISIYGFVYLPTGYISFNQQNQTTFPLENKNLSYIPFVSLCLWSFFAYCGFNGMPWVFLSELFPFKWVYSIAASLTVYLSFSTLFRLIDFEKE